jgi:hypothetical protein
MTPTDALRLVIVALITIVPVVIALAAKPERFDADSIDDRDDDDLAMTQTIHIPTRSRGR